MNIHELRQHPHLSASSVNAYIECGLQYKFSKVDRLSPEYISDSLVFGTAIHRAIEHFRDERLMGTILPKENLLQSFTEIWTSLIGERANIRYAKGKDASVLLEEGKKLLTVFHENNNTSSTTVLAIEEPFSFTIPGIPVPIIGAIDLVEEAQDGTIIISDVKTAGRMFSVQDINRNFQMTVYYHAARSNGYADRPIQLRFDVLVKTQLPKYQVMYTERSEEDEIRMAQIIRSVWDGIHKEVFVPNTTSWKCGYCQYASYCNEWFLKGKEEYA